ncbi:DUF1254 domain-containing protein [Ruegeria sp. HKCCSA071]|uniref:DUF1254 domain-containing protein n=1 Tax=Ruegeria sp. HKCCSA071 TaxID=2794834 RepID=UPI001AEA10A8|nr:DUF1254 domain-containing protein [Ruegeria sp. HKCCSA071]
MKVAARSSSALALLLAFSLAAPAQETVDTRIGPLSFTHGFTTGYPTDETIAKLYEEMDFQRAVQAYIWSIPLMGMAQWRRAHEDELGAENGQIVFVESYADKIGGLTFNATTPYVLPFIDLADGPWVVEMPEPQGSVRGAAHDMWQIGITQITEPGKYVFVGPGQDAPEAEGYKVFSSPTNGVLMGIRLMPEDRDERMALLEQIKVYPWSERDDPKPRGYITPYGKPWMGAQPVGLEYWELLNDTIQREPVFERDRFFMAMLQPLGIEKGKPFTPGWREQRILMEAAVVGEAMAKANDFSKRVETSHYRDDVQWEYATTANPDQRDENYDHLDERAAWFYEAVTNDVAMHGQKTGKGQVYMATYKDADGDWLDGGTDYVLRVPPDVPAEAFWSLTVYEVSTRTLVRNDYEIADRSSRMDLAYNDDGSVTLHIGPNEPAGDARKNWIPTEPGRAWFPYFRLYSPTKAFLDQTWVLPDIEKADE